MKETKVLMVICDSTSEPTLREFLLLGGYQFSVAYIQEDKPLEQIRYEGISSANEELRAELKRLREVAKGTSILDGEFMEVNYDDFKLSKKRGRLKQVGDCQHPTCKYCGEDYDPIVTVYTNPCPSCALKDARIAKLKKVVEAAINYRNNETRDNCEVLEEAIAALDALKEG